MAFEYKLLRVAPIGVNGQTAFVVIKNDSPEEYRLFTVDGIPARYSPSLVLDWLHDNFTLSYGWQNGRSLAGRELEIWLTLWQYSAALDAIDVDIAEAQTDRDAVNGSTLPALAKAALINLCNREIAQLRREERIIKATVYLIRTSAPIMQEEPGANGSA